jgi:ring-1,2-phenylacetyl-CoA epoxidase subunit PaaB
LACNKKRETEVQLVLNVAATNQLICIFTLYNYMQNDWPLFEVFIRSKQGLDHKHVGSLHAADAAMAIANARDVYTRRQEGVSIWVVESKHIHASNPDDSESFYDPASDKAYRHPTFYDLPDELKHM